MSPWRVRARSAKRVAASGEAETCRSPAVQLACRSRSASRASTKRRRCVPTDRHVNRTRVDGFVRAVTEVSVRRLPDERCVPRPGLRPRFWPFHAGFPDRISYNRQARRAPDDRVARRGRFPYVLVSWSGPGGSCILRRRAARRRTRGVHLVSRRGRQQRHLRAGDPRSATPARRRSRSPSRCCPSPTRWHRH